MKVQDQIRLHPSIIVVPGFRLSRIAIDDHVATSASQGFEPDSSDTKGSPSIGVVVLPRPWLSLYANGVQGFEPPAAGQYQPSGRALDVADSRSIEGGVKLDLYGGRFTASGDAFRIRRTNVPEADGLGFFRQIGEGESHGIEAEVVGSVVPGLSIQAGYAWLRTEITRSEAGILGRELPNAPRHSASIWARYRIRAGLLAGATFGAGVVYVGDRFIAGDNVNIAPAYTRLDISGSYDLRGPRLRIGLALPNATDARYVTSGAGQTLWTGTPRRFVAQVSTWF